MKKILLLGSMILLTGCGDKTPKCNGEDTLNGLKSVITENREIYENLSTNNIRTVKKDSSINMSYCAADISYTIKATTKTAFIGIVKDTDFTKPITYSTQMMDDGKNIYIAVEGLTLP